MKNDGFTLLELLAVIVLLGIIALIVTISTGSTIENSRTKLTEIQIEKIEKAAEMYYLKEGINSANYDYDETKTCVNVDYLIDNDYIEDEEIKNPKDNNEMLGSVKIVYKSDTYTYKYKDTECQASDYDSVLKSICTPVTEKTTGNVPEGNYLPGDEYICEVKSNTKYRFFVLSTNNKAGEIITSDSEDKDIASVNLIMERNICEDGTVATAKNKCTVAWMNQTDYELAGGTQWYDWIDNSYYGPVTAMNCIYKATKDWYNVPNMKVDYSDGNYGGVKTIGVVTQINNYNNSAVTVLGEEKGYTNLKARLPLYEELSTAGCEDYTEETCPTYLMDYLNTVGYDKYINLTHIPDIYGYWLLASGDFTTSWFVDTYWSLNHDYSVDYDGDFGVRPVITLQV